MHSVLCWDIIFENGLNVINESRRVLTLCLVLIKTHNDVLLNRAFV